MNRVLTAPRSARRRSGLRLAGPAVVLALACTLGVGPASTADTASDKKKLDADIAELRTGLEDTSQDLAQAFVELARTRAKLPAARRALAAADAARIVADRHQEAVATALAVAAANEARAEDALAQNARDSQVAQDQLGNLARADYQQGGVSGLSIALQASSPQDFTDRMMVMDTVMRVRDSTLRGLDTMRAEGRAVRAHLVAVRQQMARLNVQAEAALARATVAREAAVAAKARLDLLYAAQVRHAATVADKKAAEIKNLDKMRARSQALARALAARARAARAAAARARAAGAAAARDGRQGGPQGGPQGRGSGFLGLPVGAPVSSEFGLRLHPVLRSWRLHEGIDFAAGCGSPVHATAAGEVIMVLPMSVTGGYGNQLVIDHGLQRGGVDLTTTYNHLTRFAVTGGHVRRGQLVGYAGTTGTSTGCHLHFETREDGVPVNPRLWF